MDGPLQQEAREGNGVFSAPSLMDRFGCQPLISTFFECHKAVFSHNCFFLLVCGLCLNYNIELNIDLNQYIFSVPQFCLSCFVFV